MKIPLMKNTFLHESDVKERLSEFILSAKKLTMGEQVQNFEEKFSEWQGRKHSVMVNSGSSANIVLIQALLNLKRIRPGDRIGVSSITWATNVMPLIQLGLIPVFIDVNLKSMNIHLEEVKKHKINGLFITHLLGLYGNIHDIKEYCETNKILLIEDTCESLGTVVNGTKLGNFGVASTFSTFVGHHMSTIEGGVICTNDEELDMMLRMVRSHGWDRHITEDQRNDIRKTWNIDDFYGPYTFYVPAYNVRPTDINGFLGCEQLRYIDNANEIRRINYRDIVTYSKNNDEIYIPDFDVPSFAIPVVCKDIQTKTKYTLRCKQLGIEYRPLVAGNISRQPFLHALGYGSDHLPNADLLHDTAFYVPNHSELTLDDLETIKSLLSNNDIFNV